MPDGSNIPDLPENVNSIDLSEAPSVSDTTSPRHREALRLARLGVPVFPCVVNGKEPACLHSFDDATTEVNRIEEWWGKHDYNIGVSPGHIGCTVLDFDTKDNGMVTLASFDLTYDGMSDVRSGTPSGGKHVWFRGETPNYVRKWPGVDVRGHRGYVLVPPSVINDVEYTMDGAFDLARVPPAPEWMLKDSRRSFWTKRTTRSASTG